MKAKTIVVSPVLNGFVVTVGCQKVVFDNLKLMKEEIYRYYLDPESVEKEYLSYAINKPDAAPELECPIDIATTSMPTVNRPDTTVETK